MEKSTNKAKDLQAAVEAYKNDPELSYRAAAKIHKVSYQSVINHCSDEKKYSPDCYEARQKLSPVEESVLAVHCIRAYESGLPLTIQYLNELANELLRSKGMNDTVGVNWHTSFFKRHPEVKSKYSRPINKARVDAEDPDNFIEWFRRFHETRTKWGITDPDTYNMDETGSSMGLEQASKVILPSEEKEAWAKQDGNLEWATLIVAIRATTGGPDIPPFLITKGKHVLKDIAPLILKHRATTAVSDSGWSNDELGLRWIEHFDKFTRPCTQGAYRLLILDGHGSHKSLAFTQYAHENKIVLLYLPAHSTHRLQPLDVAIFGPLSTYYSKSVKQFSRYNGIGVSKREWVEWIQEAWVQATSDSNIQSAWAATGLVPFNPDRVLLQLKQVKRYTARPTTQEQPSQILPQTPPQTPLVTIQKGSKAIELPIGKTEEVKQWVDKLGTNTPSIGLYKSKVVAFIDWQAADGAIKQHQITSLQEAAAGKKKRSKKTIGVRVIDADTWEEWERQAMEKEEKKKRRNTAKKGQGKKQHSATRNTQRRARAQSTSEEGGNESDISFQSPIEQADGAENQENQVDAQLSTEPNTTVESARPTRERQLPMRYR